MKQVFKGSGQFDFPVAILKKPAFVSKAAYKSVLGRTCSDVLVLVEMKARNIGPASVGKTLRRLRQQLPSLCETHCAYITEKDFRISQ